MHLSKLKYSKEKFNEYNRRRHNVIKNLVPLTRMMIDGQNVYGYSLSRLIEEDKDTVPLKLIELYGFMEYPTRNISTLLNNTDNSLTFGARINKLEVPKNKLSEFKDMSVEYLLNNASTIKKNNLPTISEISDASIEPMTLRDRVFTSHTPESFLLIEKRISEFEINIGALILRKAINL